MGSKKAKLFFMYFKSFIIQQFYYVKYLGFLTSSLLFPRLYSHFNQPYIEGKQETQIYYLWNMNKKKLEQPAKIKFVHVTHVLTYQNKNF